MAEPHYTIRHRERRCASPKEGHKQLWHEYQVVGPRGRVMSRWDLEEQAHAAIRQLTEQDLEAELVSREMEKVNV